MRAVARALVAALFLTRCASAVVPADAGPAVACGELQCAGNELGVRTVSSAGACQRPRDGGCPFGEDRVRGCCGAVSYRCAPRPAACPGALSCACAAIACDPYGGPVGTGGYACEGAPGQRARVLVRGAVSAVFAHPPPAA